MAYLFDSVAPATSAMTAFIANAAAITGQLDHDSKAKHRSFLELTGSEFWLTVILIKNKHGRVLLFLKSEPWIRRFIQFFQWAIHLNPLLPQLCRGQHLLQQPQQSSSGLAFSLIWNNLTAVPVFIKSELWINGFRWFVCWNVLSAKAAFIANAAIIVSRLDNESRAKRRLFLRLPLISSGYFRGKNADKTLWIMWNPGVFYPTTWACSQLD